MHDPIDGECNKAWDCDPWQRNRMRLTEQMNDTTNDFNEEMRMQENTRAAKAVCSRQAKSACIAPPADGENRAQWMVMAMILICCRQEWGYSYILRTPYLDKIGQPNLISGLGSVSWLRISLLGDWIPLDQARVVPAFRVNNSCQ